jgi:acetyltransferase-like isoleucine patch superfamily enzyme
VKIGQKCFIGSDISFDGIHPEYLIIGNHVHITSGTKILTHFYVPDKNQFYYGNVVINDHAFIGINTLIVNSVTIGEGAVLAAGSVVTKDIPAWEIWGGCPAKFIRKRENPYKLTK